MKRKIARYCLMLFDLYPVYLSTAVVFLVYGVITASLFYGFVSLQLFLVGFGSRITSKQFAHIKDDDSA